MNIVGFAGSSSKASINKQLVNFILKQFENHDTELLDLNDFEVPLYSIDREKELGIPQEILDFKTKIENADLLVISMAEHNGSYTAAFKNLYDWTSRIPDVKLFKAKRMLLFSTSPGGRGGQSVMETALNRFERDGSEILGHLSIPNFYDNFKEGKIINETIKQELESILNLV